MCIRDRGALKGTFFSVNTTDDYIIITDSRGVKETYDLASNVKVTLYGESASPVSYTHLDVYKRHGLYRY